MKKIINPWRNHPEYNCFGCCPENPIGLHMSFYEDVDYIVSTWHPEKRSAFGRWSGTTAWTSLPKDFTSWDRLHKYKVLCNHKTDMPMDR